jgi:hypothetical protein
MLATILNAFYRQACRQYLIAMRGQPLGLTWGRRADVCATGTYPYQSSYFPMTNPVNIAIYAVGGFMLLALAIGFFATPG